MRTIKTRNSVKNIKVLDKSANLSKRVKDSFIRTKDKTEETQNTSHDTPTDYASDTARSVAEETAHHLTTPHSANNIRHEVSENWSRAKGYFQEATLQMPGKRKHAAEQAQKTMQTTKTNAIKLRKEADHAFNQANEAKAAVKDVKMALKQVKQSGRQTIHGIKLDSKQNMRIIRSGTTSSKSTQTPVDTSAGNIIYIPRSVSGNMPTGGVSQPVFDVSSTAERGLTPAVEFSEKTFVSQRKFRLYNLHPFQRIKVTQKTRDIKNATPVNKSAVTANNPIGDGAIRPDYTHSGLKNAKTLQSSVEKVKSTRQSIKKSAKGTVKTAKKSVKTAEKTAKKAVKTAHQTAKKAQRTAKATAKTSKAAEHAARAASKTAVQTAKVAAKVITAMVKATIAAVKGLVSIIIAGGWVALMVILIICMIGLFVGSVFGIFFSNEPSRNGQTINRVITEIDVEYTDTIDGIITSNPHDLLEISGTRASWKEVLAVYAVRATGDPGNPMEVATINDEKAALLRSIFLEMTVITYTLDTTDTEDVVDGDGLPTGETTTATTTILRISVSHKTPIEMVAQYSFNNEQTAQIEELLKPEYDYLWNALLYGITTADSESM